MSFRDKSLRQIKYWTVWLRLNKAFYICWSLFFFILQAALTQKTNNYKWKKKNSLKLANWFLRPMSRNASHSKGVLTVAVVIKQRRMIRSTLWLIAVKWNGVTQTFGRFLLWVVQADTFVRILTICWLMYYYSESLNPRWCLEFRLNGSFGHARLTEVGPVQGKVEIQQIIA